MSNKGAGKAKDGRPRRFRPALGLTYSEFVGELGPATGEFTNELHVRYGERDGLYLDWAITVVMRRGGLVGYLASDGKPLPRRRTRRFDVGIRQYTYNPIRPPVVQLIHPLSAGDEEIIDRGYDDVMTQLSQSWNARYPEPHPHTVATFSYASANRRPEFRASMPGLTNTLVAIDPDIAEEVWGERGNAYFGDKARSAAILMPERQQWKFIVTGPGTKATEHKDDEVEHVTVSGVQTTMGMMGDLFNHDPDWPTESLP